MAKVGRSGGGGGGEGGGFMQGLVLAPPVSPPNPIVLVQARLKDLETGFRGWLAKQSIAVEAAVVTATNAAQGAAIGGLLGTLTSDLSSALPATPNNVAGLNPEAIASFKNAQVACSLTIFKPSFLSFLFIILVVTCWFTWDLV